MEIFNAVLIILGLAVFEIVSSIDNAVINADVLGTMDQKSRRWFLTWGILFAVFLMRGVLPWLIVWIANPSLGPIEAFFASFSQDPKILDSLEKSSPLLLMAGSVFLIFLFFHWLLMEEKHYGLPGERFLSRQGAWFFAVVSILLTIVIWFSLKRDPLLAFSASLGASIFFIVHGFKQYAAQKEASLMGERYLSNFSKLLYLEAIDASFSIDGIIGAFAFTLSAPFIILGNGLGAFAVRQLTMKGVEKIRRYIYLKNGAMYSILFLGLVMFFDSFDFQVPNFVSPILTFLVVGFFLWKSKRIKSSENLWKNEK